VSLLACMRHETNDARLVQTIDTGLLRIRWWGLFIASGLKRFGPADCYLSCLTTTVTFSLIAVTAAYSNPSEARTCTDQFWISGPPGLSSGNLFSVELKYMLCCNCLPLDDSAISLGTGCCSIQLRSRMINAANNCLKCAKHGRMTADFKTFAQAETRGAWYMRHHRSWLIGT
jgi:hypothetical protein